ncbi:MAG: 23S rRNA (adenine(2503)-C(2))-methyltransferase RlmN [Thermodesulfobacteriota bacterium]
MTDSADKIDIKDLTPEQLAGWLQSRGIATYRANQVLRWIYSRQADSFDVITDIKKELQQLLSTHFCLNRLTRIKVESSADGTRKYLFKLSDNNCIESVLIPEKNHLTLCISTQVGCAQGCRFCLTARSGFVRNLTKNEIVSQVRDIMRDREDARQLTNIVLMGMGEPLANYDNVLRAVDTLTNRDVGLGFANRRITISTAGLVPKLKTLGQDTGVNLAVSLNATDNPTRDRLMPINRTYPIETLLDACRSYPLPPHRRITFEYILIKGINDTPDDAGRLAHLLRPIRSKINLIPFNAHEGSDFLPPPEPVILKFQEILLDKNYTVIIRRSKGREISAACGQLRVKTLPPVDHNQNEKTDFTI